MLSDLQLGDEKVTLNHLVDMKIPLEGINISHLGKKENHRLKSALGMGICWFPGGYMLQTTLCPYPTNLQQCEVTIIHIFIKRYVYLYKYIYIYIETYFCIYQHTSRICVPDSVWSHKMYICISRCIHPAFSCVLRTIYFCIHFSVRIVWSSLLLNNRKGLF